MDKDGRALAERFLVTGAMGCLGAWTVRALVEQGDVAIAFDAATDSTRADLVLERPLTEVATFVQGDVGDIDAVRSLLRDHAIDRVIHLAALQVPACAADPALGARVNVLGTVNLFQAVAEQQTVGGLSYASSFAVYGSPDLTEVTDTTPPSPRSHYGVYKLANEGTAAVFAASHQLGSIGIRPYVVYGAGRDQGLTSGPSVAMLAAVAGQPYHVGYGGLATYQLAADVAGCFIHAARVAGDTAEVVTLEGEAADVADVLAMVEDAVPSSRGQLTHADSRLPFPPEVASADAARLFQQVPRTPLDVGVRATVEHFRRAAATPQFNSTRERLLSG